MRIWRFTPGTRVELRYRKKHRLWIGRHGQRGIVLMAPRPCSGVYNHLVRLTNGSMVVVPVGNIRFEPKQRTLPI